jgi:hypothetical protein
MTDCVHAAMKPVQAPGGDCSADCTLGIAKQALQLSDGDDAVLARRQLCQRLVVRARVR